MLIIGWLHRVLITGTVCFAPDGTIVWAKLNCPGSWNDGDTNREFQERLLNERYTLAGSGVVADSAFPVSGELNGRIRTPLKVGDLDRIEGRLYDQARTLEAAIVSLRQAAEWGMGAVGKVFRRLQERLHHDAARRNRRLTTIYMLYNYRVRRTGVSQIRSVFYNDPSYAEDALYHRHGCAKGGMSSAQLDVFIARLVRFINEGRDGDGLDGF
ncbi:hypothetical protein GGF32_008953 [Allomyces javanicus]|nr:hypothetical protein GGF32_008953 [Allomyces javanicus]